MRSVWGDGIVSIQFYVVKRNNMAFWQPTPAAKRLGFSSTSLGPDGPAAWSKAHSLNAEYAEAKQLAKEKGINYVTNRQCPHKKGTLAALHWHYTRSTPFARLAQSSQRDYPRAWKYIGPKLGDKLIQSITDRDCQEFQIWMEQNHSEHNRFVTMKILRKYMKICADKKWIPYNPALSLSNPQPVGRTAFWLNHEIEQLIDKSGEMGFAGMKVALCIMWDTLFSPVDVRTVTLAEMGGDTIWKDRAKTGRKGVWTLSERTVREIKAYLNGLPFDILENQPLIRMRGGTIYKNKDTFAKDFRKIRNELFPGDTRVMLDFRRSGNIEAAIGGASAEDRADMLANSLDKNAFLEATYTPPNRAKKDEFAEKRRAGRAVLLEQRRQGMLERHG